MLIGDELPENAEEEKETQKALVSRNGNGRGEEDGLANLAGLTDFTART